MTTRENPPAGAAPQEPSHGRIWRIAGPIIISNASTPLLGMVDTAVVGHLPDARFLAAVALGSTVFSFLFWGFGFLRMGTTGLTAQASGAEDQQELRSILLRGGIIAAIVGVALIALVPVMTPLVFLPFDAESETIGLARDYYVIRIWAAPATLANYVILGWLLGQQRSDLALVVQLVLNVMNIVLDLLFVVGLGMDVDGVALASVLAEVAALGVGLGIVVLLTRQSLDGWRGLDVLHWSAFRRQIGVNVDIFVRTLCLLASFAWFTVLGSRQGETLLAANAVLMNFQSLMAHAVDGFSLAIESLVGTAIGRKDRAMFIRSIRIGTFWAICFSGVFMLGFFVFGDLLVSALTSIEPIREAAGTYLVYAAVLPLLSVWSFVLDGVFIGATRSAVLRNAMIVSSGIYALATLALVPWLGNHGLWLSLMVLMVARGVTLAIPLPALIRSVDTPEK